MPRRPARRAPRAPRRARRGLRKSRAPRSAKGFSGKVYTVTFKPASQTLCSSFSNVPTDPPITLNSASGNTVAALRPLYGTATGVSYSPNLNINSSTNGLPGCEDLSFGIDFQIQQIEAIGSYLNVFDQYRLNWVKVEVENLYSSASTGIPAAGGTAAAKPFSELYMAQDFDSVAPPTTLQAITGIDGVRMVKMTDVKNKASMVIKPKPTMVIETNPGSGGLQNLALAIGKTSQWQNSVNPAVTYYGLKMWFTNWMNTQSSTLVSALRFTFTYNVSFKQPLRAC